jgi:hypothetical protein
MEKEYRVIYQFVSDNYTSSYQFLEKINQFAYNYFDMVFDHARKYKSDFFESLGTDEVVLIDTIPPFGDFDFLDIDFKTYQSSQELIEDLETKLSSNGLIVNLKPTVIRITHSFIC